MTSTSFSNALFSKIVQTSTLKQLELCSRHDAHKRNVCKQGEWFKQRSQHIKGACHSAFVAGLHFEGPLRDLLDCIQPCGCRETSFRNLHSAVRSPFCVISPARHAHICAVQREQEGVTCCNLTRYISFAANKNTLNCETALLGSMKSTR